MTIRRQWLLVLTITAVLAVCVNSVILSSLINRYFQSYNTEKYNTHLAQLEELSKNALTNKDLTDRQLSVQLESHLDDPIVSIKLYDEAGRLVASADNTAGFGHGMMNGMMRGMMRNNSEEVDRIELKSGGVVLGALHITRYGSLSQSMASAMFKVALLQNSAVSFVIVLFVLIIIGVFVSRRLSRDLTDTALQALSIDMGGQAEHKASRVKEIRIIQSSLETLKNRLKIKQIGRKRVVDELVHQTRTPLTILKAHLEGLEDGVITMSGDEIKICQAQIDSIASIISNMSMLLDADRPPEKTLAEEVDIHELLSQITSGMKVQFEKKKISLQLLSSQKVTVVTDKYKLSQSIYNILTNAYKFTEPNGRVELTYEASDTTVAIKIKDTGVGISKEDLPHLFDAYYRGRNAAAQEGDGLGLYVARENIEHIKGTIDVQSEKGVGSTFILTLPKQ